MMATQVSTLPRVRTESPVDMSGSMSDLDLECEISHEDDDGPARFQQW